MPKTLSEQFGPDTIRKYEKAAQLRFNEADCLDSAGHNLGSIYLFGYTAEMLIKAAYFRMLRYGITTEIDRDARNPAMARARKAGQMSHEPHDFAGWARYLVQEKETEYPPAYEPRFGQTLVDQAATVYRFWRPEMRYRVTTTSFGDVEIVRSASKWFLDNYSKM